MMPKVTTRGVSAGLLVLLSSTFYRAHLLRSLNLVAYHVTAKEVNNDGILYDSCRTAMSQELFSKPRLRIICGVMAFTAE